MAEVSAEQEITFHFGDAVWFEMNGYAFHGLIAEDDHGGPSLAVNVKYAGICTIPRHLIALYE